MTAVVSLCAGKGCGRIEARERSMSEYKCDYREAQFDSQSVLGGHVTCLHQYGDYEREECGPVFEPLSKSRTGGRITGAINRGSEKMGDKNV